MSSWLHRRRDVYLPLCYYPQGSLENWHSEIVWRGEVFGTLRQAWRQGFAELGHDDFNIAVLRNDRCVGWLWGSGIVNDDPEFLDRITAKLAQVLS